MLAQELLERIDLFSKLVDQSNRPSSPEAAGLPRYVCMASMPSISGITRSSSTASKVPDENISSALAPLIAVSTPVALASQFLAQEFEICRAAARRSRLSCGPTILFVGDENNCA